MPLVSHVTRVNGMPTLYFYRVRYSSFFWQCNLNELNGNTSLSGTITTHYAIFPSTYHLTCYALRFSKTLIHSGQMSIMYFALQMLVDKVGVIYQQSAVRRIFFQLLDQGVRLYSTSRNLPRRGFQDIQLGSTHALYSNGRKITFLISAVTYLVSLQWRPK